RPGAMPGVQATFHRILHRDLLLYQRSSSSIRRPRDNYAPVHMGFSLQVNLILPSGRNAGAPKNRRAAAAYTREPAKIKPRIQSAAQSAPKNPPISTPNASRSTRNASCPSMQES